MDTEARISSLQTEYDRLLELLAQAESVDSLISLEARLSDVRYQLESYKSQLRTYDNLVDYSTVSISVSQVLRVTSPEEKSAWEVAIVCRGLVNPSAEKWNRLHL